MKKFNLKLNNKINITLILVVIICVAGIICDGIFMAKAIKAEMPYIAYIVSLVLLVCIIAFLIILKLGSYYQIGKDKFIVSICFYKLKVDYNDLLNIRHDKKSKQTIMYYYTYSKSGEQLVNMMNVNIKADDVDDFVRDLKDKNNMIVYDIFNEENDNAENQ